MSSEQHSNDARAAALDLGLVARRYMPHKPKQRWVWDLSDAITLEVVAEGLSRAELETLSPSARPSDERP